MVVELLAGLNNDRINYMIFDRTSGQGVLTGRTVFLLCAGSSGYTLDELTKFVENSKVADVPVESIVAMWTEISPHAKQSLWGVVSALIPDVNIGDPQTMPMGGMPMPEESRRIRGVRMPDGMMPPGPGMMPPPGMPGYPPAMVMPSGTGGKSQAMRTHGWPLERHFKAGVDGESAKKFLMALGRLKVDSSKVARSNMGPGMMMGPPMMGMGPMTAGVDDMGKLRIRQSALRSLVVLDDSSLANYYRELIDDAQVGDFARLGLCVLDDRESIKPLLNHFWKHPLEINTVLTLNGVTNNPELDKVVAKPGKISVPLDAMGLPRAGCSARDAMIYFDYREAGQAFLSALGELITHKDPFDNPQQVADAVCALIEGLGQWSVPETASTLADLVESTSDFGLRGDAGPGYGSPGQNSLPMQVRLRALSVLGAIGDSESMNVILRLATYSRKGEILGLAAQMALAKRGTADAGYLFLDMLDPAKADKSGANTGNIAAQIARIDSAFKSVEDIALLGLSRIELNEIQVPRAIQLIRTFGEQKNASVPDLQERLVLSLLRAGQGPVLHAISEMIDSAPIKTGAGAQEPFYWNQTSGQGQDQFFMKMIAALSERVSQKDPAGVAAVVSAVIRREEMSLIPSQEFHWEPKQYLVDLGRGMSSFRNPMRMPLGMIPMQGMMQAGAVDDSKAKVSPTYDPGFDFPTMNSVQGMMEQRAAIAGMELMSKLDNAQRYLKPLKELSYYRYLAGFMLWRIGYDAEGEELIELLSGSNDSNKDLYLKFLAIDQLQRLGNSKLGVVFTKTLNRTADRATQAKLGDGVLYLSMQTWKDQMTGRTSVLRDSRQVASQVEAWRPKIESRGYDKLLADRALIVLSTLQESDQSLKWMADMVRLQCSRHDPVSETAVGESVRILRSLNPSGKGSVLEFYLTVLNQTIDPEKARQAAEKNRAMSMMPPEMMPPDSWGMKAGTKQTTEHAGETGSSCYRLSIDWSDGDPGNRANEPGRGSFGVDRVVQVQARFDRVNSG